MKKIVLAAAAFAALVFGACSSADSAAGDDAKAFKTKLENCTNSDSLALYVGQAQAYAQKLVDEGKLDQAKKYLAEIQPVVEKKAPKYAGAFNDVKAFIDKIPSKSEGVASDVAEKAGEIKDATVEKVGEGVDATKDAAEQVADGTKDVAGKVADGTKDVAGKVVDKTKNIYGKVADKTEDVAGKVADKTKDIYGKVADKTEDVAGKVKDGTKDAVEKLKK